MRKELLVFIFTLCAVLASAQQKVPNRFRTNIPLDSIPSHSSIPSRKSHNANPTKAGY